MHDLLCLFTALQATTMDAGCAALQRPYVAIGCLLHLRCWLRNGTKRKFALKASPARSQRTSYIIVKLQETEGKLSSWLLLVLLQSGCIGYDSILIVAVSCGGTMKYWLMKINSVTLSPFPRVTQRISNWFLFPNQHFPLRSVIHRHLGCASAPIGSDVSVIQYQHHTQSVGQ